MTQVTYLNALFHTILSIWGPIFAVTWYSLGVLLYVYDQHKVVKWLLIVMIVFTVCFYFYLSYIIYQDWLEFGYADFRLTGDYFRRQK